MASSPQLQALIAESFNVPIATVFHHDRNLVDAGLRKTNGPGRGYMPQTPKNAADLLVAVAASNLVKDTIKVHGFYSKLPAEKDITERLAACPPELKALKPNHTFLDMLIALVKSAESGTLRDHLTKDYGGLKMVQDHALRVRFIGPGPRADVEMPTAPKTFDRFIYCDQPPETEDMEVIKAWGAKLAKKYGPRSDLEQVRTFTAHTLFKIGNLLRE